MKRVLVTGGANIGKAGVATMVYRWGQHFDSNKLVYDYLMQKRLPDRQYIDRIEEKGGRIYTIRKGEEQGLLAIIKWIINIIQNNHYKILHINIDTSYGAAVYIFAAKRAGCKKIIVHSHASGMDEGRSYLRIFKRILHYICRRYVLSNADTYISCSHQAGIWMFGKKGINSNQYYKIYTSEDVDDFAFDEIGRNRFRDAYGIGEKIVVGNIGRLSHQKNHKFLIELFARYKRDREDSILVLVGTGPEEEKIKHLVTKKGIENDVIFLENRNDIRDIYSAMDIFLLTSFFEGMPAVLVEAQMSFLPCVVSKRITDEVKFTNDCYFVDGWNYDNWIMKMKQCIGADRKRDLSYFDNSPFNLVRSSERLSEILLQD